MENILFQRWKWFIALGIGAIILGILALFDTVAVTLASTIILGLLLIFAGFVQIIHAFSIRQWEGFLYAIMVGLAYIIGGALLTQEPITGSLIITLVIAVCFCIGGIMRIFIALSHREMGGWVLLLLSGICGIILGAILALMPWNGLWLIGFIIAIDLIFLGIGWLHMGIVLRRLNTQFT